MLESPFKSSMVKTMHKLFTRDAEAAKKSGVHSDQNMIKVQKSVAMEWGAVIGLARPCVLQARPPGSLFTSGQSSSSSHSGQIQGIFSCLNVSTTLIISHKILQISKTGVWQMFDSSLKVYKWPRDNINPKIIFCFQTKRISICNLSLPHVLQKSFG